jgi:lysophospholipase L1-like esterase
MIIVDSSLQNVHLKDGTSIEKYRALKTGEKVKLTYLQYLGNTIQGIKPEGIYHGASMPMPSSDIVTVKQLKEVKDAVSAYNEVIAKTVERYPDRLTLVDIHSLFDQYKNNFTIGDVTYSNRYLGGFFGLDGIHPTAAGSALITNKMIEILNNRYHLSIPLLDPNTFDRYQDAPMQ